MRTALSTCFALLVAAAALSGSARAQSPSPSQVALADAEVALDFATRLAQIWRNVSLTTDAISSDSNARTGLVRRPKQTDDDLVAEIIDVGARSYVWLSTAASLTAYVVDKCGLYSVVDPIHPVYRAALRRANPSLQDDEWLSLAEDRLVAIPACARFVEELRPLATPKGVEAATRSVDMPFATSTFRSTVQDHELRGDVARAIARITSDSQKPFRETELADALTKVRRSVRGLCGLPHAQPYDLRPYAACVNAVSIAVTNPQITDPDRGIKAILVSASSSSPAEERIVVNSAKWTGDTQPVFNFVTQIDDAAKYGDACAKAETVRSGKWPIDTEQLLWVISHVRWGRKPAGILIGDTGFDFYPPQQSADGRPDAIKYAFPEEYFHRTGKDEDAPESVLDTNGDTIPGNGGAAAVNFASALGRVGADTPPRHDKRSHGLSVSTIALGGRDFERHRRYAPIPVRIAPASLLRRDLASAITSDHIARTLKFAAAKGNDIAVVNLSLTASEPIAQLPDLIRANGSDGKLVVAAAGNEGREIVEKVKDTAKEIAAYPAAWGGEVRQAAGDSDAHRRGAVLTVGAHDGAGQWVEFSNFGKSVDILAPGCRLPSYELDTGDSKGGDPRGLKPSLATGTSFAAPVVSFVSALLFSYPAATPGKVKARIQVSGDYQFDLKDRAFSSSTLNPAKALATTFDLVEMADVPAGEFKMGRVTNQTDLDASKLQCFATSIRFGDIRKIARGSASEFTLVFHMEDASNPMSLKREFCPNDFGDALVLDFQDVEQAKVESLKLGSVRDYIAGERKSAK